MSVNTPTAKARYENGHMSDPEPKTASLIAIYGNGELCMNVLEDLKAAGASYTRRNIIADMFRRLGVQ
jgi:hypothetical protein